MKTGHKCIYITVESQLLQRLRPQQPQNPRGTFLILTQKL